MPTTATTRARRRRRRGFSLVELLVVIGILAVLLGILIPTITRVRRSAYSTNSQNTVMVLANACEAFRMQKNQYPGALTYAEIATAAVVDDAQTGTDAGPVTGAENLLLALNGGLKTVGVKLTFDATEMGKGPLNDPRTAGTTARSQPFAASVKTSEAGKKFFGDGGVTANDSTIPEFLDGFPDALPILYLKARVGVSVAAPYAASTNPIVTDGSRVGPYDISQVVGYTTSSIGAAGSTGHGLRTVDLTATLTGSGPFDAFPYFRDPNSPTYVPATPSTIGTPRQKDGFVLIAAGPDRIYGTADDITNFGSVQP